MVSLAQATVLTSEQQQGKILWNQNKRFEAAKALLSPAQAGDQDAQYYLAESLSRSMSEFPKTYKSNAYWYAQAAKQGNIYVLYRLSVPTIA